MDAFLKTTSLCVLIIFLAIFFYRPIEIEDVGWHLATGKWIVETGHVPSEDPFSIVERKAPWTFAQWIGSTSLYLIYKVGGNTGLKAFRGLFFMGIFLIFFLYARKKIPLSWLLLIIFLMSFGLSTRCFLRPFIFNLIFIQFFLITLFSYQRDGNRKRLILVPLLGVVWFNIHLGAFLYGFIILGVFILAALVEFSNTKLEKKEESQQRAILGQFKDLVLTLLAFILLFLINPYGLEGALYPFKVFLLPHFINIYQFIQLVDEAQPPLYLLTIMGFWFYCLCLFAGIALKYNRKNNMIYLLLFIISLGLYIYSARTSVLFVIVVGFIIAECANNTFFNDRWRTYSKSLGIDRVIYIILIVSLTIISLNKFTKSVYASSDIKRFQSLDYLPRNPNNAIEFLKKNNIKGPVFTNDRIGGHVLWMAYPDLKPLVDGRQVNQEVFLKYLKVSAYPHKYLIRAEDEFKFKIILLDTSIRNSFRLIKYLQEEATWQLAYINGSSVIYLKRKAFNLPEEALELENWLRSVQLTDEDLKLLTKVGLSKDKGGRPNFLNREPWYIDLLEEGVFLTEMGFKNAGIKRVIEAYLISDQKLTRAVMKAAYGILNE